MNKQLCKKPARAKCLTVDITAADHTVMRAQSLYMQEAQSTGFTQGMY